LGSSAIVKVPQQVGAARSTVQGREPGSQARFPGAGFASTDFRNRFQGFQEPFPKQDFQEHVFPSKTRFPEQGFKQVFPGRGFQEEASKQGSQQAVSQAMFPGRGSQARFPATGSQETGAHTRFPRKGSQVRLPSAFPSNSQKPVPRNRFPNKFPKNRFTKKVPGKSSQAMFPGKGSQARFPGTESQARFLGRGSQAKKRFASKGSQLLREILLGNQLFLGTLA